MYEYILGATGGWIKFQHTYRLRVISFPSIGNFSRGGTNMGPLRLYGSV